MDPLDYCIDKVAAQGSPGYYLVLFQPPGIRAALLALRALERELGDVVELCTDREVALRKLNYWQHELHTGNSSTAHPVTQALQRHASGALNDSARARLLGAIAQRVTTEQMLDEAQIDRICAATAGTIAKACAHIDGANADGAEQVALATERLRLLSMPRRAGRPAHAGIALSTLTACSVTPQQFDQAGNDPALVNLRSSLLDQVLAAARHADMLLQHSHGYVATSLRLTRCLLSANQRGGYADSGRLAHVAPLRLLWHAWRSKP